MPDFDFDAFNHDHPVGENGEPEVLVQNIDAPAASETIPPIEVTNEAPASENGTTEEVDKW